jgi:hypothetical protein
VVCRIAGGRSADGDDRLGCKGFSIGRVRGICVQWWRLLGPSVLALLLLVAALARSGAVGLGSVVLLLATLVLLAGTHWRLSSQRGDAVRDPLLARRAQVALATSLVVAAGSAASVFASLLAATLASSWIGDGAAVARVTLVVLAVGPCVSVGFRCGRWWAFAGAVGPMTLLGGCLLVADRGPSNLGFVALAVVMIAVALATGSLERQLASPSNTPDSTSSREHVSRTATAR